jgi:IPT/TIG domain
MVNVLAGGLGSGSVAPYSITKTGNGAVRRTVAPGLWILLAAVILLSPIAIAQESAQVTSVDPTSGKVNDTITVMGSNLDKASVSAVYLSDDKDDFKATIVDQAAEKIVIKVPQVKPGDYNITVQEGNKLFIKPVRFKVEQ